MENKSRSAWKTCAGFVIACILILSCNAITGSNRETPTIPLQESPTDSQPVPFSPDNASKVAPEDIIQQMGSIPAYGGSASCNSPDTYSQPTVDQSFIDTYGGKPVEMMEGIVLGVCGLSEGDSVTTNIHFPNGKVESQKGVVKSNVIGEVANSYDLSYVVGLDQPAGPYRFEFQTSKGTAEATLDVIAPDGPQLYVDMEPTKSDLILYNFKPNEKVRILIYMKGMLDAWQEFTIDKNGNLTIPNDFEGPGSAGYDGTVASRKGEYVAVGEASGQVGYKEKGWYFGYTYWAAGDIYCSGAHTPVIGFGPYQYVEVISDHAFGKLYVSGSQSTIPIRNGTRFHIAPASQPYCKDGAIWWAADCSTATPVIPGCSANQGLVVPEAIDQDVFLQAAP